MANFKAGVPNGGVSGNSDWFTPAPGNSANTTFWSNGWGQSEETPTPGKGEKGKSTAGNMKQNTGSKHGKCPFCG